MVSKATRGCRSFVSSPSIPFACLMRVPSTTRRSIITMNNNNNNNNNNNTNHAAWGAVSRVTTMAYMFNSADAFSMQLCWDTSGKQTAAMFAGSSGSATGNCSTMQLKVNAWCNDATRAAILYGNIASWDTSSVTDMSYLFYTYCSTTTTFNGDISSWDGE